MNEDRREQRELKDYLDNYLATITAFTPEEVREERKRLATGIDGDIFY